MASSCLFLLPCSPLFFGLEAIALGLVAINNTVCKGIVSRHHIAVRLSREGKGREKPFVRLLVWNIYFHLFHDLRCAVERVWGVRTIRGQGWGKVWSRDDVVRTDWVEDEGGESLLCLPHLASSATNGVKQFMEPLRPERLQRNCSLVLEGSDKWGMSRWCLVQFCLGSSWCHFWCRNKVPSTPAWTYCVITCCVREEQLHVPRWVWSGLFRRRKEYLL